MEIQKNKISLLICVFMFQLLQCNCLNNNYYNEFVSKLRLKRDTIYYDINTLLEMFPNMLFYKKIQNLPENAIYCTGPIQSDTARYGFLHKYYSAIQGKPYSYVNTLECTYPKSSEFPEVEKQPLTGIDKFFAALDTETTNFKEFLDKVDRGEKPEPFKPMDVDAMTDDIMSDIFRPKPTREDILKSSAPNGIICESLKFNETNEEGTVADIIRPICYPVVRPKLPTTTTSTTTTLPITNTYPEDITVTESNDSKFTENACYFLCRTGLIYQVLACCRQ